MSNTNMPILTVEKTVDTLTDAYCSVIKKGMSPKVLPSVMLWGPPGVGKSQGIRQIAKQIEKETKKKVNLTNISVLGVCERALLTQPIYKQY